MLSFHAAPFCVMGHLGLLFANFGSKELEHFVKILQKNKLGGEQKTSL